ncbi:MAG TPA: adenine deaminase [Bacteroidia bacterium]|nr:adenine deaminase [Bacteroidia bacterium]MBP7713096.1 adenine deaminase [Bacteroidia bacterium]MBP8668318.1 adenine deaminase [Bacteroidia bacterium]HOZ83254.1 adenine deaminase [Bacteroidia bacterium]HOZ89791.1 adenine deaminase [Bacteroidia bacterium]
MTTSGNIIDIFNRRIFPGTVHFSKGIITEITEDNAVYDQYLLPGFTDAHIHIESSMLVPYEFAKVALLHGTVATVSDPHEIANVCGLKGVEYMIENAKDAKLKFNFGAPSCVPATTFETAGAVLNAEDVAQLLARPDIRYLSEMMNYPGVLFGDIEVMKKIESAHRLNKVIDGHAPGLRGDDARKYIAAGISTDHECFTLEEALDKVNGGMKILIREGSAARNFEALHTLITSHTAMTMLCSDDKHPDELLHGHLNQLVVRALNKGHNLFDVLQCACVNPVLHYSLSVGLLRVGDPADFIVINNPEVFLVSQTWINGECVANDGQTTLTNRSHAPINNFNAWDVSVQDIEVKKNSESVKVIEALDGQLITNCIQAKPLEKDGLWVSNPENDILKIAVVNRYSKQKPVVGFIKNFGLKLGAIASTVAHDSHNIIVTGVSDADIVDAVNLLMQSGGGLSAVSGTDKKVIALPVAGLMSDKSCEEIGRDYASIDSMAKQMGSALRAPFMTLSFMALLVIPHFKIGDKGLFNAVKFELTSLE